MGERAERFRVFTIKTGKSVISSHVTRTISQLLKLPEESLEFQPKPKERPLDKFTPQDFKHNRDRNALTKGAKKKPTEVYVNSEVYAKPAQGGRLLIVASPKLLKPDEYTVLVNVAVLKNGELTEKAIKDGLKAATWRREMS